MAKGLGRGLSELFKDTGEAYENAGLSHLVWVVI